MLQVPSSRGGVQDLGGLLTDIDRSSVLAVLLLAGACAFLTNGRATYPAFFTVGHHLQMREEFLQVT